MCSTNARRVALRRGIDEEHSEGYVAKREGSQVRTIGGFNGTDPAPTLAELETMAAKHEIHYYVGQSSDSFGGGSGSSAVASWVAAHFTSETVGGVTVYNLTQEKYDHSYRVARQVSL